MILLQKNIYIITDFHRHKMSTVTRLGSLKRPPPNHTTCLNLGYKKGRKTLDTSAQGLTMTIPPALTMLPETGRVTVTVPWPLFVVLVLAPPACTI